MHTGSPHQYEVFVRVTEVMRVKLPQLVRDQRTGTLSADLTQWRLTRICHGDLLFKDFSGNGFELSFGGSGLDVRELYDATVGEPLGEPKPPFRTADLGPAWRAVPLLDRSRDMHELCCGRFMYNGGEEGGHRHRHRRHH